MQRINFNTDTREVGADLIAAIVAVTGVADMHVADTYMGIHHVTGETVTEEMPEAGVYLEWMQYKGRFGLAVELYGLAKPREQMSEMEFIRQLAIRLGRPLLTSDCSANPWSYFLVKPDGAIVRVYTQTDEPDGTAVFDLACDLAEDDPHYHAELDIWPAAEPLPRKPEDAPDHMPGAMRRFCHADPVTEHNLCETFWGACPYLRIDWNA